MFFLSKDLLSDYKRPERVKMACSLFDELIPTREELNSVPPWVNLDIPRFTACVLYSDNLQILLQGRRDNPIHEVAFN